MFMCGRRFNPLDGPPNASSTDEGDDVETTSLGGNSSFEEEEEDDDAVFSRYPGLKKQETALAAMEKQQVFNFRSGMDWELMGWLWIHGKSKKSRKLVTSSPNGRNCKDEVVTTNKGETSSLVELDEFVKSVLIKSLERFGVDDLSAQKCWNRLLPQRIRRYLRSSGKCCS
ncbi:hypothetical protein HID58_083631 [Brassica napus]|uniref:Uncharacterized protein n=1 Tax=Brassica napus TaxID=3708 RepID=A0ABQ7YDZ2_BRANA|nr:hypothetical protein HID58_083631 [Brassica napus]